MFVYIWILALWTFPRMTLGLEKYVIDTEEQWKQWSYPSGGVVEITPDGWVKVGYVRKDINACLDAPTFSYKWLGRKIKGGVKVGSNKDDGKKIIDGDTTTYWAPDPEDELKDWWVDIDLGRLVTAKKIRLIFAKGRTPFPEFRIYVSKHLQKYSKLPKILEYDLIAKTVKPNTERVFEVNFDSEKDRQGNPLMGRYIQNVRIVFDKKVDDPGLAEVEVITPGENIALKTLERGGRIKYGGRMTKVEQIFDGLIWTGSTVTLAGADWLQQDVWCNWDLGATFWVDAMRFTSEGGYVGRRSDLEGFRIYVSDGTEAPMSPAEAWKVDGKDVVWERIADVNNKVSPPRLNFDIKFPEPKKIRYIFFHHYYGTGYWATRASAGGYIWEFQIFGEGFIPGVTLTSPLIDLGTVNNITSISWDAVTPPGTKIEIRTRTGERVKEITRYFDKAGNEMTKEQYERLPRFRQGPIKKEKIPVETYWSKWSPVYERPGARFASPSPSRYLLIEVKLSSERPDVAPSLNSITLFYSKAAGSRLFAEVTPKVAAPGKPEKFRIVVRKRMYEGEAISWYDRWGRKITEKRWWSLPSRSRGPVVEERTHWYDKDGNEITKEEWEELKPKQRGKVEQTQDEITGFNQVLIKTPSKAEDVQLWIGGNAVPPEKFGVEARWDSLIVELPRLVFTPEDSVEIEFSCVPFFNGTLFEVFVAGTPGGWQMIHPDPAVKNATTVMLPSLTEEGGLIRNLDISPRVITPNSDGRNDEIDISFTVSRVEGLRSIKVEIYNLKGELIKEIYKTLGTSGNYRIKWDGRDGSGDMVLPGIYVCEVSVDGDAVKDRAGKSIVVVY